MILAGLLSLMLVAVNTASPPCSIFYPDYKTVDPAKGCKYYYQCKDVRLTEESCLPYAKFNPVSAECEYWGVDCKADPKPIPAPWPQPPCYPGGPDYLTKSPRGCMYYYRCKAGIVSEEKCGLMKWFDPPTTQCIYRAQCDKPPAPLPVSSTTQTTPVTTRTTPTTPGTTRTTPSTPVTTQTTPSTPETTQTTRNGSATSGSTSSNPTSTETSPTTSETTTTQSPFPVCGPNMPDYKTVYPKDCNDYYECRNGSLTLKSCGLWYNFSPSKAKCQGSLTVDCNEQPAPVPQPRVPWHLTSLFLADKHCSYSNRRTSPDGCRYYLECHSGINVELWCPPFHYFDTTTENCRLWFFSNCPRKS